VIVEFSQPTLSRYKMIKIQELHRQAMDMAELALIHKHQGELDKAEDLFRQAYDKQKESAEFFKTLTNEEPTRFLSKCSVFGITMSTISGSRTSHSNRTLRQSPR